MKRRAYLAAALACLAMMIGWLGGCGNNRTLVAPTAVTPAVAALCNLWVHWGPTTSSRPTPWPPLHLFTG